MSVMDAKRCVLKLWILLLLGVTSLTLDLAFLGIYGVDSLTGPGIILVLLAALATIGLVIVRLYKLRKRIKHYDSEESKISNQAGSSESQLPYLIVVCWINASIVSLYLAVQFPVSRPVLPTTRRGSYEFENSLYKTVTASSVITLLYSGFLLYNHERNKRRLKAQMEMAPEKEVSLTSSLESEATCTIDYQDQLYLIPETRTSRIEHERWLQRRESLSSQKALFPPSSSHSGRIYRFQVMPSRGLSSSDASAFSQNDIRTISTNGRSTSFISGTGSSWSTISGGHKPLQAKYKFFRNGKALQPRLCNVNDLRDPPPPSWYPSTLRHTPLSDDPAILALSLEEVALKQGNKAESPSVTIDNSGTMQKDIAIKGHRSNTVSTRVTDQQHHHRRWPNSNSHTSTTLRHGHTQRSFTSPERLMRHSCSPAVGRYELRRPSPIRTRSQDTRYVSTKGSIVSTRYSPSSYGTNSNFSSDGSSRTRSSGNMSNPSS